MKKDHLFIGFLLGLIAPVIAYVLSHYNLTGVDLSEKGLSFYVLAALVNVLIVRYFYRRERGNTASGVILITFIAGLLLMIFRDITI